MYRFGVAIWKDVDYLFVARGIVDVVKSTLGWRNHGLSLRSVPALSRCEVKIAIVMMAGVFPMRLPSPPPPLRLSASMCFRSPLCTTR